MITQIQNVFLFDGLEGLIFRTVTQLNVINPGIAGISIQVGRSFHVNRSTSTILFYCDRKKYIFLNTQSVYQIILTFNRIKLIYITDRVILMHILLHIICAAEQLLQGII